MALIIVTQNQYIVASKIYHVTMDEEVQEFDIHIKGRYVRIIEPTYKINVHYTPENHPNGNGTMECSVSVRGAVSAHRVFSDLIRQVREQMPDQLYLDRALEQMLATVKVEDLEKKDNVGALHDRSAKKVRRTRKTKRRNKAVLRKTKASNRRRR